MGRFTLSTRADEQQLPHDGTTMMISSNYATRPHVKSLNMVPGRLESKRIFISGSQSESCFVVMLLCVSLWLWRALSDGCAVEARLRRLLFRRQNVPINPVLGVGPRVSDASNDVQPRYIFTGDRLLCGWKLADGVCV